jgi:hypothetical protein
MSYKNYKKKISLKAWVYLYVYAGQARYQGEALGGLAPKEKSVAPNWPLDFDF